MLRGAASWLRPRPQWLTRPIHSSARAHRALRVLGLESSADDACAAVVTSDRQILASAVCKQHDINRQWGGIHPLAAHEAHLRDMVSRSLS